MLRSLLLLFFVLTAYRCEASDNLVVSISTGTLRGHVITANYSPYGEQHSIAFFGIPFAKPPLGELRFRKPVQPEKWSGILNATTYKPACISNPTQTYHRDEGGPISEDCLYLNVFTNEYCLKHKNCAVMAVIHGGRLVAESPSAFDPEITTNNFVGQDRNIVVVSLAYRLGPLGFFNLPGNIIGPTADSNLGVRDCIEGFKWIQREIASFGGDKSRVSAVGHSAGAALVGWLTVSPLSAGLYHQQVLMSSPMFDMSKGTNSKYCRKVAIDVGCMSKNSSLTSTPLHEVDQIFACLRKVPAEEILKVQMSLYDDLEELTGPNIDGEVFPDYTMNLLQSKNYRKMSTMMGTTTAEMRETKSGQDKDGTPISHRVGEFCAHVGYTFAYENPTGFTAACHQFYNRSNLPQYMSDDKVFYSVAISHANANAGKNTPTFIYSYSYAKAGAAFKKYLPDVPSPTHSEDYIYIFGTHRGVMAPKDFIIEKKYSGMVANFVNFGDPSLSDEQKWKPWTPEKRNYFEIDFDEKQNMPGNKDGYYTRTNDLYNKIAPKFGGKVEYAEDFAYAVDTWSGVYVTNALGSRWENISRAHDRNFSAEMDVYDMLTDFLIGKIESNHKDHGINPRNREGEVLIGNGTTKYHTPDPHESDDVQEEAEGGTSTGKVVLIIAAIILVAIVGYVAVLKFLSWKKQRTYNVL